MMMYAYLMVTSLFGPIREIRSSSGELYFRRYRIFECMKFAIYIHRIYRSDQDEHPHSHPWNFVSFILSGGYNDGKKNYVEYSFNKVSATDYHKIRIIGNRPVTTLVFCGPRINEDWGYLVDGKHIRFDEYRRLKHASK